jgi:hypothetical protein
MRLLHRGPAVDRTDDDRVGRTDPDNDRFRDDDVDRDDTVTVVEPVALERVHRPFHIGNWLAVVAGAVLAAIGVVALVRGDLNESWDQPVTTVLEIDHTPLLAALEIGAGALLVLAGLSGLRMLAMLVAIVVAVAAAVAAVEPGRLASDYALEEWWAWTVAGGAAFVALVLMLPSRRREVPVTERERTFTRRERFTA